MTICKNCKSWFWYGTGHHYKTPYRICNHPSKGGKGRAPLKHETNTCQKFKQRETPPDSELFTALKALTNDIDAGYDHRDIDTTQARTAIAKARGA
jgi:hypothetical protein